jgi:UV radiation resistance-associated gene protein
MAPKSTRPLLLPVNRKVRHLRGISLRALSFAQPRDRDLDAANRTGAAIEASEDHGDSQLQHGTSHEEMRPKARRRSTLIANETPLVRQAKLEQAIESRVADAFFSLHVDGQEDPVYVSELAQRATVRWTLS